MTFRTHALSMALALGFGWCALASIHPTAALAHEHHEHHDDDDRRGGGDDGEHQRNDRGDDDDRGSYTAPPPMVVIVLPSDPAPAPAPATSTPPTTSAPAAPAPSAGGYTGGDGASSGGSRDNRVPLCHNEPTQGVLQVMVAPDKVLSRLGQGDWRPDPLVACGPTTA